MGYELAHNVAGEEDGQGGIVLRSARLEAQVCSKTVDYIMIELGHIVSFDVCHKDIPAAFAIFVLEKSQQLRDTLKTR